MPHRTPLLILPLVAATFLSSCGGVVDSQAGDTLRPTDIAVEVTLDPDADDLTPSDASVDATGQDARDEELADAPHTSETADTSEPPLRCRNHDECSGEDRCAVSCVDGACVTAPPTCDDGSDCTIDTCDPALGCRFTPRDGDCDDGDLCTSGDRCMNGVCAPGAPRQCDDAAGCAVQICEPTTGECVAETLDCDDGNPCTQDSCDPAAGSCVHVDADGLACDDGNACTAGDRCHRGACLPTGARAFSLNLEGPNAAMGVTAAASPRGGYVVAGRLGSEVAPSHIQRLGPAGEPLWSAWFDALGDEAPAHVAPLADEVVLVSYDGLVAVVPEVGDRPEDWRPEVATVFALSTLTGGPVEVSAVAGAEDDLLVAGARRSGGSSSPWAARVRLDGTIVWTFSDASASGRVTSIPNGLDGGAGDTWLLGLVTGANGLGEIRAWRLLANGEEAARAQIPSTVTRYLRVLGAWVRADGAVGALATGWHAARPSDGGPPAAGPPHVASVHDIMVRPDGDVAVGSAVPLATDGPPTHGVSHQSDGATFAEMSAAGNLLHRHGADGLRRFIREPELAARTDVFAMAPVPDGGVLMAIESTDRLSHRQDLIGEVGTGFGGALAVDSGWVFIGRPEADGGRGALHAESLPRTERFAQPTPALSLSAPEGVRAGDRFATDIAVGGGHVAIASREGAWYARLVRRPFPDQGFYLSDPVALDTPVPVGWHVAVSGTTMTSPAYIVLAAPLADAADLPAVGGAVIFVADRWGELTLDGVLVPPSPVANLRAGASVAAVQDFVAIGAPNANQGRGAVYLYERVIVRGAGDEDVPSWIATMTYSPDDLPNGAGLGSEVAITMVGGNPRLFGAAPGASEVRVFEPKTVIGDHFFCESAGDPSGSGRCSAEEVEATLATNPSLLLGETLASVPSSPGATWVSLAADPEIVLIGEPHEEVGRVRALSIFAESGALRELGSKTGPSSFGRTVALPSGFSPGARMAAVGLPAGGAIAPRVRLFENGTRVMLVRTDPWLRTGCVPDSPCATLTPADCDVDALCAGAECDAERGCVAVPHMDAMPCSEDGFCARDGVCRGGDCVTGDSGYCDTGDACLPWSCDEVEGCTVSPDICAGG